MSLASAAPSASSRRSEKTEREGGREDEEKSEKGPWGGKYARKQDSEIFFPPSNLNRFDILPHIITFLHQLCAFGTSPPCLVWGCAWDLKIQQHTWRVGLCNMQSVKGLEILCNYWYHFNFKTIYTAQLKWICTMGCDCYRATRWWSLVRH